MRVALTVVWVFWCVEVGRSFVGRSVATKVRSRVRVSDDENVEESEEAAAKLAKFKARLLAGGLDAVSTDEAPEVDPMWARMAEKPGMGKVLLGREAFFFQENGGGTVYENAMKRVGFPLDLAERVPDEGNRRALLPAILLVSDYMSDDALEGLLLGRRSGFMFGDFAKDLDTSNFVVQPLWIGGPEAPWALDQRTVGCSEENQPTGIVAIHPYELPGAAKLNDDGLYFGGHWNTAKLYVDKGMANPFRFRIFAQATRWDTSQDLQAEVDAGAWTIADVSTELILKDRERGSVVWREIQEAITSSSSEETT